MMKRPETFEELRIPQSADVTNKALSFSYEDACDCNADYNSDCNTNYNKEAIFSGLSVSARPGDIGGVTGPVACGKSAFGRAFLCRKPYGGSIRFDGRELSDLSPREIAATVGYLGHDPELFADTVENNVLCGSSGDAMKPLAAVKPDEEVRAMKDGLQTVIGSDVRLSGGQAQRLALARMLAHPCPVMILDDPFSALDRNTEDAVFADLQAYAQDKVVLSISHRVYENTGGRVVHVGGEQQKTQ